MAQGLVVLGVMLGAALGGSFGIPELWFKEWITALASAGGAILGFVVFRATLWAKASRDAEDGLENDA